MLLKLSKGNEKKKCHCGAKNCSSFLGVRPKNQVQEDKAKKTGDKRKKKRIKKTVVKEGTWPGEVACFVLQKLSFDEGVGWGKSHFQALEVDFSLISSTY